MDKNSFERITSKISIQIISVILVAIIIFIFFVQSFLPSSQKAQLFETTGGYVSTLTHGLAYSIGDYMRTSNSTTFDEIQKWFKKDKNVLFLSVKNDKNKVLFNFNPYDLSYDVDVSHTDTLKIIDNHIYINSPIDVNGKCIGNVFVIYSLDRVFKKMEDNTFTVFGIGFFILFGSALLIVRMVKHNNVNVELARTKESDRLKSEFLSQLSHEIRTPLNSLNGVTGLLEVEIEYNEAIDPDLRESVNIVKVASNRIIRTIDLLVDYSILRSKNYEEKFQKLDLNKILNVEVQKYLPAIKEKNLTLNYTEEDYEIEVIADSYSLLQIINNIIDNAVKYTEKGSINIFTEKNVNDKINLIFSDTGIGISQEYIDRIYEPFSQEETGYQRSYDGNGLGFSLIKEYCNLNQIDISINSIKNTGTEIKLTFNKREVK